MSWNVAHKIHARNFVVEFRAVHIPQRARALINSRTCACNRPIKFVRVVWNKIFSLAKFSPGAHHHHHTTSRFVAGRYNLNRNLERAVNANVIIQRARTAYMHEIHQVTFLCCTRTRWVCQWRRTIYDWRDVLFNLYKWIPIGKIYL